MLKCDISKERNIAEMTFRGTAEELAGEILGIVRTVYRTMASHEPAVAESIKDRIIALILDPNSPVWEEETPC